jgi:hypothetical protein
VEILLQRIPTYQVMVIAKSRMIPLLILAVSVLQLAARFLSTLGSWCGGTSSLVVDMVHVFVLCHVMSAENALRALDNDVSIGW